MRYSCRMGTARPHPRISVSEHLILPAIVAEVGRLTTPDRLEATEREKNAATALEGRRVRILDMYDRGDIDRVAYAQRLEAVAVELAALESKRVVMDVPAIDWTWGPRQLNAVLLALFERIDLDPATFQPVTFEWTVPEWRS